MIVQAADRKDPAKIEELKRLIDDESYLSGAVSRIAQVLSDQLLGDTKPGAVNERKR